MRKIRAGVDEVGRGSLIGPVFAATVIFKKKLIEKKLKTQKNCRKKKGIFWRNILRETLFGVLVQHR